MSLTCCDCGLSIARPGKRGPKPQRCTECKRRHCSRLHNERRRKKIGGSHSHCCKTCGSAFQSDRKRQPHCSVRCARLATRTRFEVQCENQQCKKTFLVTPGRYSKGTRCCSNKCKHAHMRLAQRFCQNPACGKKIDRQRTGPRSTALGKDKGKYCCRECAWDHRWGSDRPRRDWGRKHLAAAAATSLRTLLRKKCKVLDVPYDEECTRLAVCERDEWICQLCGIDCNREYIIDQSTRRPDDCNAEHDHIVPLTAVGSPGNVFPNSQCLCRKCNNKKRDRSWGQLRLDLEGSVKRWESGARVRRQQNSRSFAAIPASVL